MPDPTVIVALLALVAFAEASPFVRLPLGLLLAVAMLADDLELLPVALIGAAGVMLARLSLSLSARRGRDRLSSADPAVRARRDAMQRHLSGSPAFVRTTFLLGAMPFMPANFIFPLLGAMRAPLWPALLGTIVGRTPALAFTAAIFAWLGRGVSENDDQAAVTLGFIAILMLLFRLAASIDWEHRAATGTFRLRNDDERAAQMAAMFGAPMAGGAGGARQGDGHDIVEGELLGEEVEGDDEHRAKAVDPGAPPPGDAR